MAWDSLATVPVCIKMLAVDLADAYIGKCNGINGVEKIRSVLGVFKGW